MSNYVSTRQTCAKQIAKNIAGIFITNPPAPVQGARSCMYFQPRDPLQTNAVLEDLRRLGMPADKTPSPRGIDEWPVIRVPLTDAVRRGTTGVSMDGLLNDLDREWAGSVKIDPKDMAVLSTHVKGIEWGDARAKQGGSLVIKTRNGDVIPQVVGAVFEKYGLTATVERKNTVLVSADSRFNHSPLVTTMFVWKKQLGDNLSRHAANDFHRGVDNVRRRENASVMTKIKSWFKQNG